MKLHLFNPDFELSLVSDTASYTPPAAVRRFVEAGAMLPAWWADEGDLVLAAGCDAEARRLGEQWGLRVTPVTSVAESPECAPWGWSRSATTRFMKAGVSARSLPSHEEIEEMRRLCHRATAVELRRHLGIEPGRVCRSVSEVAEAIAHFGGQAVIKSPWSCSGRGVFMADAHDPIPVSSIEGIIRRQGAVVVERRLDRRADFAALYWSTGLSVKFGGLSLTISGNDGNYLGNLSASDGKIEAHIAAPGLDRAVEDVRAALQTVLNGRYKGPLGVDMMVVGDNRRIWPCIEINLRRTMGFVARDVFRRTHTEGVIAYHPSGRINGIILSGKTDCGCIALTPLTDNKPLA